MSSPRPIKDNYFGEIDREKPHGLSVNDSSIYVNVEQLVHGSYTMTSGFVSYSCWGKHCY